MYIYKMIAMMTVVFLIVAGCGSSSAEVVMPALADQPTEQTFALDSLDQVRPVNIEAQAVEYQGRKAIQVDLEGSGGMMELLYAGLNGNQNLVMLPVTFKNGTIELDMAGEAHLDEDPTSRGFVGVAFRSKADASEYEAFYFRVTNGSKAEPKPDAERLSHAVQYISIPTWDFDVSREQAPGQYEKGANVAPSTWFHVRIEVDGSKASIYVDDETTPSLEIPDMKLGADAVGGIGLWTGLASTGYFSNLKITHR